VVASIVINIIEAYNFASFMALEIAYLC